MQKRLYLSSSLDTISNSEKFLNELLKDFGGIDGALNKLEVI